MSYNNYPPNASNMQTKGAGVASLLLLSVAAVQIASLVAPLKGEEPTASTDLMERIDRDWARRREAAHVVFYKVTGNRIQPQGFLNRDAPLPRGKKKCLRHDTSPR